MISADKIAQFREELRRGRTSQAGRTLESDHGSADRESGADFSSARGAVAALSDGSGSNDQDQGEPGSDDRSASAKPVGKRPDARGARKNHRSASPDHTPGPADSPKIVGNLEAAGPVKERLEKPNPTFSKEEPKQQKKKPGPKSEGFSAFSDKEAEEMSAELPRVLMGHFEDIDEYLWNRQKQKFGSSDERPVWSDLDEDDCNALASAWVKVGKKNRYVAEAARITVDSSAYIKTVILVTPRFRQTAQILRETYIPRKSRLQRNAPGE